MKSYLLSLFFLTALSGEESSSLLSEISTHYSEALLVPEACVFTPPLGWLAADPAILPENVKAMVVGKGKGAYPPSINIGIEPYNGTLKSYLKLIQSINESQKAEFKDLGQISTESGNAALCQVDMRTEWGNVRLLHGIVVRYGSAYILTAAALKDEFPDHYKDFFQSIRSLKINKDVFEQVKSLDKRAKLLNEIALLKERFEEESWSRFESFIAKEFNEMGPLWKDYLMHKVRTNLTEKQIAVNGRI